jgi:hypothetical protein
MRLVFAVLAIAVSLSPRLMAQEVLGDAPIRFVLPPGVEPGDCHFQYQLVGSFGKVMGPMTLKRDAFGFDVPTVYKVIPGEYLKVLLYCSGVRLHVQTYDSLPDLVGQTVRLDPKPIRTVPFVGMVRGLASHVAQGLPVNVTYWPWWFCEFFELADCALGGWKVAFVKLDRNAKFSVQLPDFVGHTSLSSFKQRGEFQFRIGDQNTGGSFQLRALGRGSPIGSVPAANRYPGTQLFDVVVKQPKPKPGTVEPSKTFSAQPIRGAMSQSHHSADRRGR